MASALVYSRTADFRHDSIPTAIRSFQDWAPANNYNFTYTEDQGAFTPENLVNFDAIVLISCTGEVLDDDGKEAFLGYLAGGGGLVGIHSSTDILRTTPFIAAALGARFDYHPDLQPATFLPLTTSHPSTASFPNRFTSPGQGEEVYNFKSDPRSTNLTSFPLAPSAGEVDQGSSVNPPSEGQTNILLTVEQTYRDPDHDPAVINATQGTPHPIAWCRDGSINPIVLSNSTDPSQNTAAAALGEAHPPSNGPAGTMTGRMFYTSLGHTNETWQDNDFLAHVRGGVQWVLEAKSGNSSGGRNSTDGGSGSTSGSTRSTTSHRSSVGALVSLFLLFSLSGIAQAV